MRPESEARLVDGMRRVVVGADGDVRVERARWSGEPAEVTTVPLHLVLDREIFVTGSLMYTGADMRRAIELLDGGVVAANDLVTATFPLEAAAEAFAAVAFCPYPFPEFRAD